MVVSRHRDVRKVLLMNHQTTLYNSNRSHYMVIFLCPITNFVDITSQFSERMQCTVLNVRYQLRDTKILRIELSLETEVILQLHPRNWQLEEETGIKWMMRNLKIMQLDMKVTWIWTTNWTISLQCSKLWKFFYLPESILLKHRPLRGLLLLFLSLLSQSSH